MGLSGLLKKKKVVNRVLQSQDVAKEPVLRAAEAPQECVQHLPRSALTHTSHPLVWTGVECSIRLSFKVNQSMGGNVKSDP